MSNLKISNISIKPENSNAKVFSFPVMARSRSQLGTPLDGRYGAMDPQHLRAAVAALMKKTSLIGVRYIVGIPEGGVIPAYEFASSCGLTLILASHSQPADNDAIKFIEPHSYEDRQAKYIFGLNAGDKVIIVEDEITTGRTIINCVRSLRNAGVVCEDVVAIYCSDDLSTHEKLISENIRLSFLWSFNSRIINAHSE
jgi:orotate phosphoribosyltransferase